MLVADVAWRDEMKMLELQRRTREAVTGVPDAVFTQVGRWVGGEWVRPDRFDSIRFDWKMTMAPPRLGLLRSHPLSPQPRTIRPNPTTFQHYRAEFLGYNEAEGGNYSPVVYRCLTHMRTWELMAAGCSVEALVQHELWLHERESRLLFTHPPSFPCRGLVVIIDVADMKMKQATKDIFSIFAGFAHASKVYSTHLPCGGVTSTTPICSDLVLIAHLKVFIFSTTSHHLDPSRTTPSGSASSTWWARPASSPSSGACSR